MSATLALVTAALRTVTSWAKKRLDELDRAEAAVNAEVETKRAALDRDVRVAAAKVDGAAAQVDELSAKAEDLKAEIARLAASEESTL